MTLSLYDATVPAFQQTLGAVAGLLDKAEAHCHAHDIPAEALIEARLADDMLPFAYQVKSVAAHSQGAIVGVRAGMFAPDRSAPPSTFDGLRARVSEARAFLDGLAPAEVDALAGGAMRFSVGTFKLDFVAESFLLSFSLPNFYFHATTAYDILRANGVAIGKMDYLGRMRTAS